MRFWDEIEIVVQAGNGGNGLLHWRREAHLPMGGPDGGDGGRGGAVYLVADLGTTSFVELSYHRTVTAEDGHPGDENRMTGRDGESAVIKVPVGTQVYYQQKLIADLAVPGARWIAARGGHGGKGNAFFKSSTNQAPEYAQPGQPGERLAFSLVLKSVADVGLIGLPNVGKSTLLSALTSARPKIANYPFTTLMPQLGVAIADGSRKVTYADIPGLIPDAHLGKGLGIQFLRHIERTTVLLHLIDASLVTSVGPHELSMLDEEADDKTILTSVEKQFRLIDRELELFSETLRRLPRIVVFSKADLPISQRAFEVTKERFQARGFPVVLISSETGEGLSKLSSLVHQLLDRDADPAVNESGVTHSGRGTSNE